MSEEKARFLYVTLELIVIMGFCFTLSQIFTMLIDDIITCYRPLYTFRLKDKRRCRLEFFKFFASSYFGFCFFQSLIESTGVCQ